MVDQMGNFDYVDVIAKLMIKLIEKNEVGVFNIAGEEVFKLPEIIDILISLS